MKKPADERKRALRRLKIDLGVAAAACVLHVVLLRYAAAANAASSLLAGGGAGVVQLMAAGLFISLRVFCIAAVPGYMAYRIWVSMPWFLPPAGHEKTSEDT